MTVRSAVRWAATHGAMRLAIKAQVRRGNPDAEVLSDPAVREDPYGHYERLRTGAPFAGGAFARVSVHHDVCTEVLRSDDFGVIGGDRADGLPAVLRTALRLAGPRPSIGPIDPPSMLAVDPPEHTRYRRLVSRAFTARAVAHLRERTGQIAAELLDDLERDAAGGQPVDLVARYASLLPVTVISEMLGVPVAMREQFLAWGDGATPSLDIGLSWSTYRSVERNLAELDTWFHGHLRRLRREPGDDLLSQLVDLRRRRRQRPHRAGAGRHRRAGVRRRVRDDGQPDRQRHALLFANPDQRAPAGRRPVAVAERRRRDAARRVTGAAHRTAGQAGHHGARRARCARASWCCSAWPAPTATRRCSTTRTASTSPAPTPATTSRSPAGSTSAWAPRWPGWRARWRCARCSSGSRTSRPPVRGRRRSTIILRGYESLPVTLGRPTASSASGASSAAAPA